MYIPIYADNPASLVYQIKKRLEYMIATKDIDEREVAYLEDELLPSMEQYLQICDKIFDEIA